MTSVLIIFLIIIILLGILLAVMMNRHRGEDFNNQYIDEENDHIYYDRSIIEKKQFHREHPDAGETRTFRRLFKGTGKH